METANLRVRVECSAAESTGQLRVLTEDTDLIPSTHMSQLSITSPQISNALSSGLCRHQAHTVDTDAQTTHEIINKNRVIWKRGKKVWVKTLEQKARRLAPKHISAFCNFLSLRSEVKITTEKSLDRASTQHCSTASFSQFWQKCKFSFDVFLFFLLDTDQKPKHVFIALWTFSPSLKPSSSSTEKLLMDWHCSVCQLLQPLMQKLTVSSSSPSLGSCWD